MRIRTYVSSGAHTNGAIGNPVLGPYITSSPSPRMIHSPTTCQIFSGSRSEADRCCRISFLLARAFSL
ncbi:unnamed protein product, partial [Brassica oleracea]